MLDNLKKTYVLLIHAHVVFHYRSSIDGCIYPPFVSNELDQYLSEPLFAQISCKIDAPVGGEIFSTVALIVI